MASHSSPNRAAGGRNSTGAMTWLAVNPASRDANPTRGQEENDGAPRTNQGYIHRRTYRAIRMARLPLPDRSYVRSGGRRIYHWAGGPEKACRARSRSGDAAPCRYGFAQPRSSLRQSRPACPALSLQQKERNGWAGIRLAWIRGRVSTFPELMDKCFGSPERPRSMGRRISSEGRYRLRRGPSECAWSHHLFFRRYGMV
jgi:hypothetical protein